ncbi:Bax inhibitor-1 family protein [Maioricimonas sp. JC845]|uniref:Bax inhibitor-1/YccA family protein n=1 Tax=Maioricimonas sp. JC845 TaxID=3232138 RepID=UPI0034596465
MSYAPSYSEEYFAADAAIDERVAFIRRTYAHVFGAVLAFAGLVTLFVSTPAIATPLTNLLMGGQWFFILIAFMIAGFVAQRMAQSGASPAVQYAGLGLYVFAEAIIFTPLLVIVNTFWGGPDLLMQAGVLTLFIFAGLTAVVMITKADFSFMRYALMLGGFAALALIAVASFTSLTLGTWFVGGMIVLMSGYILYDTSNVLHHYRTDQHVAAALALFASLATLFWYVIQLLGILNND